MQHRWIKTAISFSWRASNGTAVFPLQELMEVRQLKDWAFQQMAGLQDDPKKRTGWRQSKPGQQIVWAEVFTAVYGDDWLQFACKSTSEEWRASEKQFVDK
eukprot:10789025-Karenia_brevis.AAC.1